MGIELFAQVELQRPAGEWYRVSFHEFGKDTDAQLAVHDICKSSIVGVPCDLGEDGCLFDPENDFGLRVATPEQVSLVANFAFTFAFRAFAKYVSELAKQARGVGVAIRVVFWEF